MKRFTATEKWDKLWFQKLPSKLKLLWLYMADKADSCGVWEVNLGLASFSIGEDVNEGDLSAFGDRLEKVDADKIWIKSFVRFQYGENLNEKSPVHKSIIKRLLRHGIYEKLCIAYGNPIPSLSLSLDNPSDSLEEKDKEKVKVKAKEKVKVKDKVKAKVNNDSVTRIIGHLNKVAGTAYSDEAKATVEGINARLSEKGVTEEGVLEMIDAKGADWAGTKFAQFLRPATLFGPTNFANYYGQRKLKRNGRQDPKPNAVDANGRITEVWK